MSIGMLAQQRSMAELQIIAERVLNQNSSAAYNSKPLAGAAKATLVATSKTMNLSGNENGFVVFCNSSTNDGFVILSTDSHMPEVLAFAEHGSISNMPDNARSVLASYVGQEGIVSSGLARTREMMSGKSMTIAPLLGDINYSQHEPYNLLCPLVLDTDKVEKRTPTGCLPTAMAQVMKYYEYPKDYCKGSNSYETKTLGIALSQDFSKYKIDWANIIPAYGIKINVTDAKLSDTPVFDTENLLKEYAGFKNYVCLDPGIKNISGKEVKNVLLDFVIVAPDGRTYCNTNTMFTLKQCSPNAACPFNYFYRPTIPSYFPDGNYTAYLAAKLEGSNVWQKIINRTTKQPVTLVATKSGYFVTTLGQALPCAYDEKQEKAIAELMYNVGVANSANYTIGATSASFNNYGNVMKKHFGYDPDMYFIFSNTYSTDNLYEKFNAELKEGRPISICGTVKEGGSHQFIADGVMYQDDLPYYHINWGWAGECNGYFLLYDMTPQKNSTSETYNKNYGYQFGTIFNCKPDNGIDENEYSLAFGTITTNVSENKDSLTITADRIRSLSLDTINDIIADVYLVSESTGERTKIGIYFFVKEWLSTSGFTNFSKKYKLPESIKDGKYHIDFDAYKYTDHNEKYYLTYYDDSAIIITINRSSTCEAPVITFANNEIQCTSSTPGAKCHYTYSISNAAGEGEDSGKLNMQLTVTAYAYAEGYEVSETVTRTFDLNNGAAGIHGDVNGDGIVTVGDANEVINIYLTE